MHVLLCNSGPYSLSKHTVVFLCISDSHLFFFFEREFKYYEFGGLKGEGYGDGSLNGAFTAWKAFKWTLSVSKTRLCSGECIVCLNVDNWHWSPVVGKRSRTTCITTWCWSCVDLFSRTFLKRLLTLSPRSWSTRRRVTVCHVTPLWPRMRVTSCSVVGRNVRIAGTTSTRVSGKKWTSEFIYLFSSLVN